VGNVATSVERCGYHQRIASDDILLRFVQDDEENRAPGCPPLGVLGASLHLEGESQVRSGRTKSGK
jgi:hypothetical protein